MEKEFTDEVVLKITVGHLLVVWDVLANKIGGTRFLDALGNDEKRAIWALEDMCERSLVENGFTARPAPEWNSLVRAAREHVRSIPVEFLHI
jgi:hypothetical protein